MASRKIERSEEDPLWYKDAIIYELHVRAFKDSAGDGMGDFRGLTEKLDYLEDLGVTAIWLLPFYPSPWRDDGYDIADYGEVHPAYGTMRDFREFLREAHRRNLKVITELVINHTSDQHPWFQKARRSPRGSKARDMYVWSETDDRYSEARIIFTDTETSNWAWDPVAQQYYWHRFFSHQPDLNFDNPAVHEAIFRTMAYWFKMGVDGMRLDAIPYLYERDGTNCENLPETHEFLKSLRSHVDANFSNRMLLAEANQWPEDTVPYLGDGDACHMAFHFPVMPRLFMAVRMEDRFPIIDILEQTPPIPESCQWATFLRNHDELTLEMVTDEERDYMYRVYANDPQARINVGIRRRLAPLLDNSRRKIELLNALLFALPGTPVIYYGDEIGMGDNIYVGDRNGVRTPMQWSADRNAGFSRANPQRLYLPLVVDPGYHYETVNVEAQQANPSSLLWWMKRLIALRKQYRAFGRGTIEFLLPDNRKVLAFVRRYEDECILVVANLSRMVQYANIDLSAYQGTAPVELFGRNEFPRITDQPYFVTLGPHAFYWFELRTVEARPGVTLREEGERRPSLTTKDGLDGVLGGASRSKLEGLLPAFLPAQRWFQGKARSVRNVKIRDVLPLAHARQEFRILLIEASYVEGEAETYVLPVGLAGRAEIEAVLRRMPTAAIADVPGERDLVLYDAAANENFRAALFALATSRKNTKSAAGRLSADADSALRGVAAGGNRLLGAEQSNTSIVYGDAFVLKMYRRLEEGMSLDLEIGRFLTEVGFEQTPRVYGSIEYRSGTGEARTLAVIQQFVPNEGDAWSLTGDAIAEFFERAAASPTPPPDGRYPSTRALLDCAAEEPSDLARSAIGTFMEDARLLGQRTGELHLALALDGARSEAFDPEPFTIFYQRSIYQSMRNLTGRVLQQLRSGLGGLPAEVQADAGDLLARESELRTRFKAVIDGKITALRTRHHGDFHLGQVLFTGKDFFITDFEGEPIRPLSERRMKRSPLRDVAGMLRSFHYAVYAALLDPRDAAGVRHLDRPALEPWANFWYFSVSAAFLREYLLVAGSGTFLPAEEKHLIVLLDAYLLEKAVYELGYELNNRPDWAMIPLRGLLQLLSE